MRILTLFTLLVLLGACSSDQKAPLISGLLWGGEGHRLVVKPEDKSLIWSDTILINHLGEFEWNRDSIIPGFYRLEKSSDASLVFFLKKGSAVFIDAQYISYPEEAKLSGTEISQDIFKLEKNSKEWLDEIAQLSKKVEDPAWIATESNRLMLKAEFDSIRLVYRQKAIELSPKPLVRYLALHQTAGNNALFDPWADRALFFKADSSLAAYRPYKEFINFAFKVDSLYQLHLLDEKVKPGSKFPSISLPDVLGDSIPVSRFLGTPLYVEVWQLKQEESVKIHALNIPVLSRYSRQELEVYMIALDTATNVWKESIRQQKLYYNNVIDTRGLESTLINDLGIMQFPSNFIVDANGIVIAKNIWGLQLENGLDLLLKK